MRKGCRKKYRNLATLGERLGLKNAAKSLNRYLDAEGGAVPTTKEEAHKFKTFAEQEKRIQGYYRDITIADTLNEKIKFMKDGETIRIRDDFDAETKPAEFPVEFGFKEGFSWNKAFPGALANDGLDFILDFGATETKSTGEISMTKWDDRAIIIGNIENVIDQKYDFNKQSNLDREMRFLVEQERAKIFSINGRWRQNVFGTADVIDGKLENIQLYWEDGE